jgi:hypothetical protein
MLGKIDIVQLVTAITGLVAAIGAVLAALKSQKSATASIGNLDATAELVGVAKMHADRSDAGADRSSANADVAGEHADRVEALVRTSMLPPKIPAEAKEKP